MTSAGRRRVCRRQARSRRSHTEPPVVDEHHVGSDGDRRREVDRVERAEFLRCDPGRNARHGDVRVDERDAVEDGCEIVDLGFGEDVDPTTSQNNTVTTLRRSSDPPDSATPHDSQKRAVALFSWPQSAQGIATRA